MDVLLSTDKSKNAGNVWNSLSTEQQNEVMASMDTKSEYKTLSSLKMPKFELEYDSRNKLDDSLKELGCIDMYQSQTADFGSIAPSFFVSNTIHKTVLKVDEEGSKAAAAVTANRALTCPAPSDEVGVDFVVDRPFVFCIRDKVSGIILFIGEVNNLK